MENLIDNMGLNKACPKDCVCLTKPNKLVDAITRGYRLSILDVYWFWEHRDNKVYYQ